MRFKYSFRVLGLVIAGFSMPAPAQKLNFAGQVQTIANEKLTLADYIKGHAAAVAELAPACGDRACDLENKGAFFKGRLILGETPETAFYETFKSDLTNWFDVTYRAGFILVEEEALDLALLSVIRSRNAADAPTAQQASLDTLAELIDRLEGGENRKHVLVPGVKYVLIDGMGFWSYVRTLYPESSTPALNAIQGLESALDGGFVAGASISFDPALLVRYFLRGKHASLNAYLTGVLLRGGWNSQGRDQAEE